MSWNNRRTGRPGGLLLALALLLASLLGLAPAHQAQAAATPGTVVVWGDNTYGQRNVPPGLTDVIAIDAGIYHHAALKSDGTVVAWGINDEGQTNVPVGLTGVIAIASGGIHTAAVKRDGTVVAWGNNALGQTNVPVGLTDVVAISAGQLHTVALKRDGTVVAWGGNDYGEASVPAGLTGVTAIAAGYFHSLAVKSDGTVVTWGSNSYGEGIVPAGLSDVTAVAGGIGFSVALKRDGSVLAWGWNNFGQTNVPAGLAGVTAIAAGQHHALALKSDGSIVAWGLNLTGETNVPAARGPFDAIEAGSYGSIAIARDVTAPVASPTQSPAATGFGWTSGDVTVSWNWSDAGRGIDPAQCTTTSTFTGEGPGSLSATCADLAGNVRTASYDLRVDSLRPQAAPNLTPAPNAEGWNRGDVNVEWRWRDNGGGSGLDAAACAPISPFRDEGELTLSASCADRAGNVGQAQYLVRVDRTAPTISAAVNAPPPVAGWYSNPVPVRFSCADALSGIAPGGCPADQFLTAEGAAVSASALSATDRAGNRSAPSNVVTVAIDQTPPTISAAATTAPNIAGWYNVPVTVQFSCADALSGIPADACPASQTLSAEGVGVSSAAPRVNDVAGNRSAPSNVVTVQIDRSAPAVAVTGVTNGASYPLGSVPAAACSTSDALSGVATQASVSLSGGNPDGTGSFTATCAGATDNAGNSGAPISVSYSVAASTVTNAAISPVLECVVTNGDGTYTARFGYLNRNSAAVTVAVGANNKFTPSPIDRGQTTRFEPGRQVNTFQVTWTGGNLVWTLKGPDGRGRTSTASPSSKACS